MAIVAVFQDPTLTQEIYEQSVQGLTDGKKKRMEAAGDWPVQGLLAHIAGQGPKGFRVVDVWESEEAFQRFGDHLMPIMEKLGVRVEPEIYPTFAFVSG